MYRRISNVLSLVGTLLIIATIISLLPFTIPKLFGYHIYGVLTPSMEPEYPVGSLVYVKSVDPETVKVGEVITFRLGADTNLVMTHRVAEVDKQNKTFVTKGDANKADDENPVRFDRIIGVPVYSVNGIAYYGEFIRTPNGISCGIAVFGVAIICWIIGETLRKLEKVQNRKNERMG